MPRQWKQISFDAAKQHPLYGVRNWLAVFAFGVVLGPLRTLGEVSNAAHAAGLTLPKFLAADLSAGGLVTGSLVFTMLLAAILLWLLFSKHPNFRIATIALLILQWPAYLAMVAITGGAKYPGFAGNLVIEFLGSSFLVAIWVVYLQRSRRVRVTFEHCIVLEKVNASAQGTDLVARKAAPLVATNDAYAEALTEIEEGRVNKGLWARAFSESGGDEGKAKALYIKTRAESTKDAAVWVDTRPPSAQSAGVKVTDERQAPPLVTNSFATSPIEIGVWVVFVLAIFGWWQSQEYAKRQELAARPVQTPIPQVDSSEFKPVPNVKTGVDWDKGVITPPPALPAQTPPQNSRSKPQLTATRESATEAAFSPQVQADLNAIAARAVSDYPYLDTPAGQEVLDKIAKKRDEFIQQGQYPSVALTNAVNAFAPANAPRPNQEKKPLPVLESGDKGNHAGFDPKCRWVTPQEWSCK